MAANDKKFSVINSIPQEFVSQGLQTLFNGEVVEIWRPAISIAGGPAGAEPVILSSLTTAVAVSLTRPADTAAYTAQDVISNATSSAVVLTFANLARKAGGSGYITKARILTNQSTNTARLRLHLFQAAPDAATVKNDNSGYTLLFANKDKKIGSIDFAAMTTEAAGSDSARTLNTDIRLAYANSVNADIYGVLETLDAFTPISAQQFYIELTSEQN